MKTMKMQTRLILFSVFLCAILLVLGLTPLHAANAGSIENAQTVPILCNGRTTGTDAILIADGVSYLPVRSAASLLLPDSEIQWDSKNGITVKSQTHLLHILWGTFYIESDGHYYGVSGLTLHPNLLKDGVTYVPLRAFTDACGVRVLWNAEKRRIELTTVQTTEPTPYDTDTLYWLSRILYAEAGDQTLLGQLAVGSVIMNRVDSSVFPDSVTDVIFDNHYGIQFTPVANGSIKKTPSDDSILCAKLILDGFTVSKEALYFLDPTISDSHWIEENCTYLFSIGCHDFYK